MGYPLGSFVWEHLLYTLLPETVRELLGAWPVSPGMGFVVPVYWLLLLLSVFTAVIATATARIKQQNYEMINLLL